MYLVFKWPMLAWFDISSMLSSLRVLGELVDSIYRDVAFGSFGFILEMTRLYWRRRNF